ncbi:MAG: hypothetical protein LBQ12_07960 [Deltaproteobacteria bacterium]|jgi:hypothetical protein|nr:hypothetical protein [Deltaproteobacteria bacterium]
MSKLSPIARNRLACLSIAAAAAAVILGASGKAEAQTGFFVNSPDGNSGISLDIGDLIGAIAESDNDGGGNTYYNETTIINQGPRRGGHYRHRDRRHPPRHDRGYGHGGRRRHGGHVGPPSGVHRPGPGKGGPGHGGGGGHRRERRR